MNAATARDFGNGPEWVLGSSGGYKIIYTRYLSNQPHSAATANIAKAGQSPGGWKTAYLPNTLGFAEPIGNINPSQSDPPVVFRAATTTGGGSGSPLYYQGINDSMPVAVPNSSLADGSSRLVEGQNLVIYTSPVADASGTVTRQVFTYDIGAGVTTQLTFDSGNKGDVYMWQAPEFNNAWVFFVSINGEAIRYYRLQVNSQTQKPQWTPFQTTGPLPGEPLYLWSPEPFVYKGKSYLFMVRSPSSNPKSYAYPTQIWLSSMDNSINRQISDPATTDRVRQDPEVFITGNGPYIYYNRYTLSKPGVTHQQDGIWRSDTGLGP